MPLEDTYFFRHCLLHYVSTASNLRDQQRGVYTLAVSTLSPHRSPRLRKVPDKRRRFLLRQQSAGMENGAYASPLDILLRRLICPLFVEALLAQCTTTIAVVIAEIAVARAAGHQVVTVVAFMAQVAIRTVEHLRQPL